MYIIKVFSHADTAWSVSDSPEKIPDVLFGIAVQAISTANSHLITSLSRPPNLFLPNITTPQPAPNTFFQTLQNCCTPSPESVVTIFISNHRIILSNLNCTICLVRTPWDLDAQIACSSQTGSQGGDPCLCRCVPGLPLSRQIKHHSY